MVNPSENKIRDAIHTISPAPDAHDRMLARIRAKAAQQESDLAPTTSETPKSGSELPVEAASAHEPSHITTVAHPSLERTNTKPNLPRYEIRSRLLVLAACFLLLIGSVTLYATVIRRRTKPQPTESTQTEPTQTGTRTAGGQVLYNKTFSSTDELEKAVGIRLIAPASATEVLYFYDQNYIAGVRFTRNVNMYYLYACKGDLSAFGNILSVCEESPATDLAGATLWQGKDMEKAITWSDGSLSYCLFTSDEATVDDVKDIYKEIRK